MVEEIAFKISNERSPHYRKWIEQMSGRLKERLPFAGPFDTWLTLGSGLDASVEAFSLDQRKEIKFSEIGFPEGANAAHEKKIVVGITPQGKKLGVAIGKTAAMEVPVSGIFTNEGHLEQMEVASAALNVVETIGVENVIETSAAGGFNHPMFPGQPKPFDDERLPVIGVIGADVMFGYPMEHLGHFMANQGGFFALRDGDKSLNDAFIASMAEVASGLEIPSLFYASIPAVFEDPGLAYLLINNGVQAVGMTYGPTKTHLSGANNQGERGESGRVGKFMGITVITDRVELYDPKDPTRQTPFSVAELRMRYPQEFELLNPSLDPQVRAMAAKANEKLGKALAHMVDRI